MPVRDGEQCSIGFQPVPRDHCTWPCEIGNDLGVPQGRRSIGARYRLEAYATLSIAASPSFSTRGVSDPGRGSKWTSCLKGLHYKGDLSVLV
jgi:hypothetical protein